MRRTSLPALLSLVLLLGWAGCAPADAERAEMARALRMLGKAIAALDDSRARLGDREEPAVAGAVAELRLVVHQAERTAARLATRVPAATPGQLDALRASTERLRTAALASPPSDLRVAAEEVEVHAQQVSAALRAVVDGVRPRLRRATPEAGLLTGRVPSRGGILAARGAAGLYTAATLAGLVAALAARDKLARRRRRLNGLVFAGLAAFGLAAATAGAPMIAALMAPELAIPDGEQICATAISRGAALDRALRIAVERQQRRAATPPRPLTRRELLVLVRGGSERGLLAQSSLEGSAGEALPAASGARPSAQRDGADLLAREVRELSAECVAFGVAGEAAEEARYFHALAAEYLGQPLSGARPPLVNHHGVRDARL